MKAPLLWVAVFLILGILSGAIIQPHFKFLILCATFSILIALLSIRRKIIFLVALSATFFFIGCFLFQIRDSYSANHAKNFTPYEPEPVYIKGLIIDEPNLSRTSYGEAKADFILSASGFQKGDVKQQVTGKVKVFISGDTQSLNYGDKILLSGYLSRPRTPGNPGEFDYARYLKRHGIFSILSAKGHNLVLLEKGGGNPILHAAFFIRKRIKEIIDSNFPQEDANFLNAVLLGQRQEIDFELNDAFMKTGTVHLLAISGLHVGLLVFLIMLIFRALRIPTKVNIIATMAFLVFYAILTSGRPSVVRATVMAEVVLFGLLIARESSIWNSLGLSAIIILGFEPNALFDIGFQLSFISVASISYITPKLEGLFYYDRKLSAPFISRGKRYFIEAAFVSAAAWLGVLPFVSHHFDIITPIATIANLIAVPLTFLIISSSIPFIIFGTFTPFIGKIFAGATWLLCATLFGITDIFSRIPFGHLYFPKPSALFIFIYYIFLVALLEHKRLKISIGRILIVGLFFMNIMIWQAALKPNDEKLKVTVLDVGHGDSIFIEYPNGGNMLIDGGRGQDFDVGRNIILPFLHSKGVHTIDAVVATHSDADHIGGLASVVKELNVRQIYDNGFKSESDVYLNFEEAISRKGIKRSALKRGDSVNGLKDIEIICLNPPIEWVGNLSIEDNDASLVIKINYKDVNLLFCADVEQKAINEILRYGWILDADVIMLPHHGEKLTSTGQVLIEEVSPKYAIISQGRSLKEVLRSKEAEDFLVAQGINVFRTNRDGAVFVEADGKSIVIDNFKRY